MDRFYVEAAPIAENKTYVSGQIRLSIITDHILRLERVEGDTFADLATQKIMHPKVFLTTGKHQTIVTIPVIICYRLLIL